MILSILLLVLSSVVILANASHAERFRLENRATNINASSVYNSSASETQATNACASVSAIASTQRGDADHTIEVPAQLAYDCLQSVPLDKTNASRLVKSFRTMFEFQSTSAFNKNPPNSYKMPAIDAAAVFDQIQANITSGAYHGEYDFQLALYKLVLAIHDDHLEFTPDLLGDAFRFTRPVGLTSLSSDGGSVPKLFVVGNMSALPDITTNASAVTAINAQPANDFLAELSEYQTGQDPDTNYNRLLLNLATFSSGNETGAFSKSKLFPGANTTIQFEDGSTKVYENKATVRADFLTIDGPEALYAQICLKKDSGARSDKGVPTSINHNTNAVSSSNPKNRSGSDGDEGGGDGEDNGADGDQNGDSNSTGASKNQPESMAPALIGYPNPIVRDKENVITGYHLTGNLSDTAVLAISGFGEGAIFQSVVTDFLAKSSQARKSRLIIDLQSNGGGDEDPECDLFGQLFPTTRLYEASAWRASPIFKAIAQTMDQLRQSSNASFSADDRDLLSTTTPDHESFNFRDEISVNFTNFDSFTQWYGPFEYNNDTFTSASQFNLSTPASGKRQQGINQITGYGRKANTSIPVFQPQNIVILTNGDCSSMCASVIEQTRTLPGIKFVTVGGRAQYGEMAIAGGTHGGGLIDLKDLASTISNVTSILKASFPQKLQDFTSALQDWDTYALTRASGDPQVNTRNTLRRNDTSGVPTQFMFDAADCRIFYTRGDLTNMVGLWGRVADVAFGRKLCSRTGQASGGQ